MENFNYAHTNDNKFHVNMRGGEEEKERNEKRVREIKLLLA